MAATRKQESDQNVQSNNMDRERIFNFRELPATCPAPEIKKPHEVDNTVLIKKLMEQQETFRQLLTALKDLYGSILTQGAQIEYYNTPQTVIDVGTSAQPNSPDVLSSIGPPAVQGYQREQIYNRLHRIAPRITVINDGRSTGGNSTLFVISTSNGSTWTSESPILVGEARTFFNVWELRLRSPVAGSLSDFSGGVYRVTEYDYWLAYTNSISGALFTPIEKALVHNTALPAIGASWLATDITPTNTPSTLRILVAVSIAGNFQARITNGGNTQVVVFNTVAGPALVAGGLYEFEMLVHAGDTVNFSYSTTGGTIQVLRVQEIDAAT